MLSGKPNKRGGVGAARTILAYTGEVTQEIKTGNDVSADAFVGDADKNSATVPLRVSYQTGRISFAKEVERDSFVFCEGGAQLKHSVSNICYDNHARFSVALEEEASQPIALGKNRRSAI